LPAARTGKAPVKLSEENKKKTAGADAATIVRSATPALHLPAAESLTEAFYSGKRL
jgi:hypothetical protein